MKGKILISFIMVFILLLGTGCGKGETEEDLIQPIAVERIEESGQENNADHAGEKAGSEETPDASGEEDAGKENERKEDSSAAKGEAAKAEITQKTETGTTGNGTMQANPEKAAYYDVLHKLYTTYTLPDGTELGYDGIMALSENKFAICDIDQDGKEELVIYWTTTYTAGMAGAIYGFDSASGKVRTELLEFPAQTFYDNGVVRVELSHNHGLAGNIDDFWPHTLYQYNKDSDAYAVIAEVDAWNKAYYELDYDGSPFPADMDKDGDGILYRVTAGGNGKLMDLEEYQKWQDSVIGGAKKVEIPFMEMTEENIKKALETN